MFKGRLNSCVLGWKRATLTTCQCFTHLQTCRIKCYIYKDQRQAEFCRSFHVGEWWYIVGLLVWVDSKQVPNEQSLLFKELPTCLLRLYAVLEVQASIYLCIFSIWSEYITNPPCSIMEWKMLIDLIWAFGLCLLQSVFHTEEKTTTSKFINLGRWFSPVRQHCLPDIIFTVQALIFPLSY